MLSSNEEDRGVSGARGGECQLEGEVTGNSQSRAKAGMSAGSTLVHHLAPSAEQLDSPQKFRLQKTAPNAPAPRACSEVKSEATDVEQDELVDSGVHGPKSLHMSCVGMKADVGQSEAQQVAGTADDVILNQQESKAVGAEALASVKRETFTERLSDGIAKKQDCRYNSHQPSLSVKLEPAMLPECVARTAVTVGHTATMGIESKQMAEATRTVGGTVNDTKVPKTEPRMEDESRLPTRHMNSTNAKAEALLSGTSRGLVEVKQEPNDSLQVRTRVTTSRVPSGVLDCSNQSPAQVKEEPILNAVKVELTELSGSHAPFDRNVAMPEPNTAVQNVVTDGGSGCASRQSLQPTLPPGSSAKCESIADIRSSVHRNEVDISRGCIKLNSDSAALYGASLLRAQNIGSGECGSETLACLFCGASLTTVNPTLALAQHVKTQHVDREDSKEFWRLCTDLSRILKSCVLCLADLTSGPSSDGITAEVVRKHIGQHVYGGWDSHQLALSFAKATPRASEVMADANWRDQFFRQTMGKAGSGANSTDVKQHIPQGDLSVCRPTVTLENELSVAENVKNCEPEGHNNLIADDYLYGEESIEELSEIEEPDVVEQHNVLDRIAENQEASTSIGRSFNAVAGAATIEDKNDVVTSSAAAPSKVRNCSPAEPGFVATARMNLQSNNARAAHERLAGSVRIDGIADLGLSVADGTNRSTVDSRTETPAANAPAEGYVEVYSNLHDAGLQSDECVHVELIPKLEHPRPIEGAGLTIRQLLSLSHDALDRLDYDGAAPPEDSPLRTSRPCAISPQVAGYFEERPPSQYVMAEGPSDSMGWRLEHVPLFSAAELDVVRRLTRNKQLKHVKEAKKRSFGLKAVYDKLELIAGGLFVQRDVNNRVRSASDYENDMKVLEEIDETFDIEYLWAREVVVEKIVENHRDLKIKAVEVGPFWGNFRLLTDWLSDFYSAEMRNERGCSLVVDLIGRSEINTKLCRDKQSPLFSTLKDFYKALKRIEEQKKLKALKQVMAYLVKLFKKWKFDFPDLFMSERERASRSAYMMVLPAPPNPYNIEERELSYAHSQSGEYYRASQIRKREKEARAAEEAARARVAPKIYRGSKPRTEEQMKRCSKVRFGGPDCNEILLFERPNLAAAFPKCQFDWGNTYSDKPPRCAQERRRPRSANLGGKGK
mmetsp:Transcript_6123/g.16287  ORF Transcript_6123/g.16287 Transcript_6123/m.16287 type:complete len:1177 (-) Transcript_6123:782-4312(-)